MRTTWVLGVDVSTQTVKAMLAGVRHDGDLRAELVLSEELVCSEPWREEVDRKTPDAWLALVRECVDGLRAAAKEVDQVRCVGVSTTFPGVFPILKDGSIDPALVSLYDNMQDAGICSGAFDSEVARAEDAALSRMWPGNMAVGLARLVKDCGLRLEDAAALVPPNTALAHTLRQAAGCPFDPRGLFSDFSQTIIGGLYEARTAAPAPEAVLQLLRAAVPQVRWETLRAILPPAGPAWRNVLAPEALPGVRRILGLPALESVSIGAGDSTLAALVLAAGADTVVNVRGSSDSPIVVVPQPRHRTTPRETVLHNPVPSAVSPESGPWHVVAPLLRSGRVWDWAKRLRFDETDADADAKLETLASAALKRRLRAPEGSPEAEPLRFYPALGGERAPDWDPSATGTIGGLIESHGIGDIALAALEGMSAQLRKCIASIEDRYEISPSKLVVVGGPARNALWNWITQVFTGKRTFATTFSDVSVVGAALIGWAALWDGQEDNAWISSRLGDLSKLASEHPLIRPLAVGAPDAELAELGSRYLSLAAI